MSADPETDLDTEGEESEPSPRAGGATRIALWAAVAVMAAGWIFLFYTVLWRSLAPPAPPPPPAAAKPAPALPVKAAAAPPAAKATASPAAAANEALRTAMSRYGRASVTAAQDEAQRWYDRWVEATRANHPSAADARKHLDESAAKVGLTPAQMGFDMNIAPAPAPPSR